jgi:hypothetical protein
MASDRRTTGMYVEDENIEWKAIGRLSDSSRLARERHQLQPPRAAHRRGATEDLKRSRRGVSASTA